MSMTVVNAYRYLCPESAPAFRREVNRGGTDFRYTVSRCRYLHHRWCPRSRSATTELWLSSSEHPVRGTVDARGVTTRP